MSQTQQNFTRPGSTETAVLQWMGTKFNWLRSKATVNPDRALRDAIEKARIMPADRSVEALGAIVANGRETLDAESGGLFDYASSLLATAKRNLSDSWHNRADYALKQEPHEGLRTLEKLLEERGAMDREAPGLTAQIEKRTGDLTRRASERIIGMIGTLPEEIKQAREAAGQATPGSDDAAEVAKRLRHLIDDAPRTVELATLYAKRCNLTEMFQGKIDGIGDVRDALLADYERLLPKRRSAQPPEAVQETTGNPALPNLAGENKGKLDKAIGRIAEGMSKDTKPAERAAMLDERAKDLGEQNAILAEALRGDKVDPEAEIKARGFDWNNVKARFKEMKSGPEEAAEADAYLQTMWWFRRMVVDAAMLELQKKYGFDWASVGSANLESDYDISVKSHGQNTKSETVYDFQIVQEFNDAISARFGGRQPGTIFDTNLYASAEAQNAEGKAMDFNKADGPMKAMAEQGQDVGALMKLRRFMDWEEYDGFQNASLAEMNKDAEDCRKRAQSEDGRDLTEEEQEVVQRAESMRRQFEEADAIYFESVRAQLIEAGITDVAQSKDDVSAGVQKALLEQLKHLQEDNPDKMMQVNNKLYVKAMVAVRQHEDALNALAKESEKAKEEDKPKLQEDCDVVLAKLKTAQADAVYYAAEAYHSEGPFKFTVWADQGAGSAAKNDSANIEGWAQKESALRKRGETSDEEIGKQKKAFFDEKTKALKKERLDQISLTELLQAFNENLGDLLKDVEHYAHEGPFPGKGFYRASKYLGRFCDSVIALQGREAVREALAGVNFNGKSVVDVKGVAAKLTSYRGGKVECMAEGEDGRKTVMPPSEGEAWAADEMAGLGCRTLGDLASMSKKVGTAVNAILRKAVAAEKMATGGREAERPYFGAART